MTKTKGKKIILMKHVDRLTPEGRVLYAHRLKAGMRSWARLAVAAGLNPSEVSRLICGVRGAAKHDNRWKLYVALAQGQVDLGHHTGMTIPQVARGIMVEAQNATVTNAEIESLLREVKDNLRTRDQSDDLDANNRDEKRLWSGLNK